MKKILIIGLLVLAMTGTAWSFSATFTHGPGMTGSYDFVTDSPGLVGDLLIFPMYLADGSGWETKINVINTSRELSTVAKVVIRGGENSQELLDFFIYLSPNDEWNAKIYNDNGTVRIYSTDDSVLSNVNVWANESPMNQALAANSCDAEVYGYVEVFDAWFINRTDLQIYAPTGVTVGAGPIDKDIILAAFEDAGADDFESANILTGFFELMLPTMNLSALENAVVMQDYDINDEVILGRETRLGESSRNSIGEVEGVLAKDDVYMPYYNDGKNVSAHVFTFVTKQAIIDPTELDPCNIYSDSPFYDENATIDWCIEYGIFVFDLEENTPTSSSPIFSPVPEEDKREFCNEVNISVVGLDNTIAWYDEGWALFSFEELYTDNDVPMGNNSDIIEYSGAPVIPFSVNLGGDGLALKYGAYAPADVYRFGSIEP